MKIYLITLLMLLGSSTVFGREVKFPLIKVTGLSEFTNKKLSVFYVSGRPAGIGTQGSKIITNKIWNSRDAISISDDGIARIPETIVENKYGIAFNYVLFVVHDENQLSYKIKNADETCPALATMDLYKSRKVHCKASQGSDKSLFQRSVSVRQLKKDVEGLITIKLK
jgi:hypothetical protein